MKIDDIVIMEICDFDDFSEMCELLEEFITQCSNTDINKYSEIYTWDIDYIEDIATSEIYELYIMLYKNTIIGCLKIDLFTDSIYISDILISSRYRNKGLARILINKAIENNMDNEEQKYCELDVQCENRNALIAYIKMGFVANGFRYDNVGWLRMRVKKEVLR